MTPEKLASVFEFYHHYMDEVLNCYAEESPYDPTNYKHLMWMCDTAAYEFIPAGRVEKAMRWLGFVQGVLVAKGVFTLEDVKNHSRPDQETKS